MQKLRFLLSFTLSFTIAFPPNVWAQAWSAPSEEALASAAKHLTPAEMESLKKIIAEKEELEASFQNPAGPVASLDDFDLIQQDVVDLRQDKINAQIAEITEKDFAVRRKNELDFLKEQAQKNYSRAVEFIGADRVQLAAEHLGLDAGKDLLMIIDKAYTDDSISGLLDVVPEDVEHFVDDDLSPRRLYKMNLKVNLMYAVPNDEDKKEVIVETIDQKKSEGSTASSFSERVFYISPKDASYRFDVTTSKGEVIHRFNRPVDAVGFYGRFLIYVNKDETSIRVIDLDYYKGAIGNTQLPSFEIPFAGTHLQNLEIKGGSLYVNNKAINYSAVKFVSEVYQAYFNIKVALLDPRTVSSANNLIKELIYYMDQYLQTMDKTESDMIQSALGGSETVRSMVEGLQKKLETQSGKVQVKPAAQIPEKLKNAYEFDPEMLATFTPTINVIEKEVRDQGRLNRVNQSIMTSRQFFSRLNLLMAKLSHPQPMGSPKIIQGMIMLAESSLKGDWSQAKKNWNDLKQHPVISYGRFGAPAIAAAAIGATISDSFAVSIYETLQMGKVQILDYLHHVDYGMNFLRLAKEAASTAGSGLGYGWLSYFSADKLPKLGVLGGAMVGLILSIYGSLHLTANVTNAVKYFSRHRGWIQKARSEGSSLIGAYAKAFVKYENALKLYYDQGLAQAEAKKSSNKFSAAHNEIADELLKDIKERPGFFQRIKYSLLGAPKSLENLTDNLQTAGDAGEDLAQDIKKNTHLNQITTVRKALTQFAMSYPSTVITSRFNGTLWNYWFMIRTFALTPRSWPMFLVFPELFRTAIDAQPGRVHMPSRLNGGYRTGIDNFKFVFGNLNTNRTLKDLRVFEKSVLPIEAIAYDVALEKALEATIKKVKNPEKLKEFFESGNAATDGLPTTGIRSVSDPKLERLSKENQTYFRTVFNSIYSRVTADYLKKFLDREDINSVDQLKEIGVDRQKDLNALNVAIKNGRASGLHAELNQMADDMLKDGQITSKASEVATSYGKFAERFLTNSEHKVIKKLDPKNRQVSRFKTAERQLGNIKSVIRAINAVVSEIVFEKGAGLLTILVMYSTVESGMLAPLQPDLFGPDSWFYGSRYLFLNGFATGVIMSALASVWMKVQMDDRIEGDGGFDKVPTAADTDRSYFRYYLKSFFKNPMNKWSKNQMLAINLAWANMSAAFVTIAITNFLTLGRFDLGAFLTGYMIVFLTPLSGIDYKIDQTHELASRWQASKVIRKLRAHPKMMNWINTQVLKKRMPHTLGSTAYNFFMGPFLSLYEMMDTDQFGKRSFLRLLLNGYQPEEIISAGLQKVNEYLGFIPGIEHLTSLCESLLTNNNTALDPSRLLNPPTPPIGGN